MHNLYHYPALYVLIDDKYVGMTAHVTYQPIVSH